MDENLFVWDPNMRGIMIKYLNLKLQKNFVEIVEEQTNVNIPIKYEAIYFIPEIGCDICKIVVLIFRWRSSPSRKRICETKCLRSH